MTVLTMNHVQKRSRRRTVLRDVSLRVRRGTVFGLLGPNGAGKSTTLAIATGSVRPTSGSVTLFDTPWDRSSLRRVGASVDGPALFGHLSGWANLRIHSDLLGLDEAAVRAALAEVGLAGAASDRASRYSTGMRTRLAIAIAILGEPELVILDEPHNGLDPDGIQWLRGFIRRMASSGSTILLSSHLLAEVAAVADDIGCIVDGYTVFDGTRDEFAPDGDLERAYARALRHRSVQGRSA